MRRRRGKPKSEHYVADPNVPDVSKLARIAIRRIRAKKAARAVGLKGMSHRSTWSAGTTHGRVKYLPDRYMDMWDLEVIVPDERQIENTRKSTRRHKRTPKHRLPEKSQAKKRYTHYRGRWR